VTEYSLRQVKVDGYYMEFGVFTGGTMRFNGGARAGKTFHGFDSFQGLPEDWGGFSIDATAFDVKGKLPKVPANVKLYPGGSTGPCRNGSATTRGPSPSCTLTAICIPDQDQSWSFSPTGCNPGQSSCSTSTFNYPVGAARVQGVQGVCRGEGGRIRVSGRMRASRSRSGSSRTAGPTCDG